MFGFLFGAACLGGLGALLFRRRHSYHAGCGHFRGYGHGHSHRGRHLLNVAFERLDTTPGQEKAVVAAIDEFRDSARAARQKVMASRGDVAAALRDDHFEPERVRAVVSRNAEEVAALGDAGARALAKVHEALDPEQRKRLARWIESGPGFFYG